MMYLKLPGLFPAFDLISAVQEFTKCERHSFPEIALAQLAPELYSTLEQVFDSPIVKTRVFITPPRQKSSIHIDGSSWTVGSKWAVNFPISGCENTLFEWYKINAETTDLKDRISFYPKVGNSISVSFLENEIEKILDSVELTEPTLVKVNAAHRAINQNEAPRIILSCRFKRSVVTQFEDEVRRLQELSLVTIT